MKKAILFLLFSVFAVQGFSDTSYDFSAVCQSGQTLYYKIINSQEVNVVEPRILPNGPWYGFDKPVGDLVVPENVEYEGNTFTVVSIGENAFGECYEVTSVMLPSTIRSIGHYAFGNCTGLTGAFVIPEHCTFIGSSAFWECSSLTSLTIGAAVDTIQWSAFENCTSLQTINCNTATPPFAVHIASNPNYDDRSIFNNVPTDIPVFVNCLTIDQFRMNQDWSRFTNLEGVFLGAPSLTVNVNNPDFGTAEIISVPMGCDDVTATVRATPGLGHVFGYWKRNGVVVSYNPEYTFTLDHNANLVACFDCSVTVYDSIGYPVHVNGRAMNTSGQVTAEHVSDFIYSTDNGQLTKYVFPANLTTRFNFHQYPDMPSYIYTEYYVWPKNEKGPGPYYETYSFDYENHQRTHSELYTWTDYFEDPHYYWDYYYDNNHISQEDFSNDEDDNLNRHLYSYKNGYKTQIDKCYKGHSNNLVLSTVTTNNYNEQHKLLTSQTDTYNNAGEVTSRTLKTYTYTDFNKADSVITQTYSEGNWINTGFAHYVYDFKNRIVEYHTGSWSVADGAWNITKKIIYDFNDELQTLTVSFRKKSANEWVWDKYSGQSLFNDSRLYEWERSLGCAYGGKNIGQIEFSMHYDMVEMAFPVLSEWYYKIQQDNGGITYQDLQYTSDTTINNKKAKIIVRTNQIYDKDGQINVSHEYIKEEGNKVFWWNKELHEFTTLYDYSAEMGDEWEIKVGTESVTVHVDSTGIFEYQGDVRKVIHISDAGGFFNGDIVVGFGHLSSFFPEKLMRKASNIEVNGLRCYWVGDALVYHHGDEDCDAIHNNFIIDEDPFAESGFAIYPNPTDGLLRVVGLPQCDSPTVAEYRITNVIGQTLLTGRVETRHGASLPAATIDVSSLPVGMYFIQIDQQTSKFIKQ